MKLKSDCIFCRIIGRQSLAYIVLESDNFICFFPLEPDVHGHTLIVSKEHYSDLRDCPVTLGADLLTTIQNLSKRYAERLGATGFNLLNANGSSAGQSVDHLHFHFLPRFPRDGINAWPVLSSEASDPELLFKTLTDMRE